MSVFDVLIVEMRSNRGFIDIVNSDIKVKKGNMGAIILYSQFKFFQIIKFTRIRTFFTISRQLLMSSKLITPKIQVRIKERILFITSEAVAQRFSVKKVFLKN